MPMECGSYYKAKAWVEMVWVVIPGFIWCTCMCNFFGQQTRSNIITVLTTSYKYIVCSCLKEPSNSDKHNYVVNTLVCGSILILGL